MNLTPELQKIKEDMEVYARGYGLDFFDVIFEVLDWKQLNEVASYGGFPNRYPHWRFGMEYEDLSKKYSYGLSKIYEMVINNDPCYAYLLYCNNIVDQKLVMAHVYAHCDFFKNNLYFAHTNRKMMDEMANHRSRILRYVDQLGLDKVEEFVDACLSVDTLIDHHAPVIKRVRKHEKTYLEEDGETRVVHKIKGKPYMDRYINPPEFMEEQRKKLEDEMKREEKFPESPERDVMGFLMEYAPINRWERDILSMIREEAYYFIPQGQTKIMNEGWACVTGDTLVATSNGLLPARKIVEERLSIDVHDGVDRQQFYDWAFFAGRDTVKIETRRGLILEGSVTHQILMADGGWRRLDNVKEGDRARLVCETECWCNEYQQIDWKPHRRSTLQDIADEAGVSVYTVLRHKNGRCVSRSAGSIDPQLAVYESQVAQVGLTTNSRKNINIPKCVDEQLASFMGYLVGDGHISRVKRTLGLTSGDEIQADHFAVLGKDLFNVEFRKKKDDNRWRITTSSEDLSDFLEDMGLKSGIAARIKDVPPIIFESPRSVVRAFLRAYFDCDGYAGPSDVILSTASMTMSRQIQQLLLNFGVLTWRKLQKDGVWQVRAFGRSAKRFMDEIGFGLERKQKRLKEYVLNRKWFKEEDLTDEIVSVQAGCGDVYDFSVSNTHCYVANGFVNHNSYWHSKIMTQKALKDSELIDYADHHSGTVAPYPGRLNPYKIGLELFRDIEDRWNKGKFGKEYDDCTNMVEKFRWNKNLGLGRQKMFDARKLYNDITFIDEFLTPEFCKEQKLFVFAYNPSADEFEIAAREFYKIKEKLLFQLTNFGYPVIAVADANYGNRGELLLKHQHDGVDLKVDYGKETLKNVFKIWRRPVNIETVVDGVPKILCFDGQEHKEFRP